MTTPAILNDRYQIGETIGTGGMALVYKAKDLMLERMVAVKILREDFSEDVAFRERFRQEAKAAANLSHPNIVTVHDFGLDQGHLFIVMEYLPGTDLKTYLQQHGRLSVSEALELMIQACQGVGFAHRAGLVHCDIKPHNMLVTPDQRLKVTDFGIARALASISPEEHHEIVWGSPHYFSPEQASGQPPSPASDVYSLGVILYEMLTGRLPFIASNSAELARMHREDTPVAPRFYNPNIPPQLQEIILKVLSKEPSARYRTADQLGRLLQGIYESDPALKRSVPFLQDTSRPLNSATGALTIPPPANTAASATPPRGLGVPLQQTPPPLSQPVATQADEPSEDEKEPQDGWDWSTWLLGLLAFTSLFGLIPFWLYVYITLKP